MLGSLWRPVKRPECKGLSGFRLYATVDLATEAKCGISQGRPTEPNLGRALTCVDEKPPAPGAPGSLAMKRNRNAPVHGEPPARRPEHAGNRGVAERLARDARLMATHSHLRWDFAYRSAVNSESRIAHVPDLDSTAPSRQASATGVPSADDPVTSTERTRSRAVSK